MEHEKDERALGLSTAQVVGSVLAAVTGAVLASTMGVTGTVIGAAVASLVATIGSAIYTWSLRRTTVAVTEDRGPGAPGCARERAAPAHRGPGTAAHDQGACRGKYRGTGPGRPGPGPGPGPDRTRTRTISSRRSRTPTRTRGGARSPGARSSWRAWPSRCSPSPGSPSWKRSLGSRSPRSPVAVTRRAPRWATSPGRTGRRRTPVPPTRPTPAPTTRTRTTNVHLTRNSGQQDERATGSGALGAGQPGAHRRAVGGPGWCAGAASPNDQPASASLIASTNAGRSPGLRLVIRLPSTTTSSSTQFAPAFFRSRATLS